MMAGMGNAYTMPSYPSSGYGGGMTSNPYTSMYSNPYTTAGMGYGNMSPSYASGGYGGNEPPQGSGYGSGYGSSGYASQTSTTGETIDVGIYDNSFKPTVTVVDVGTTIRWTNTGRHHHTITSKEGLWDSGPLSHGDSYSVLFIEPGVYDYFCVFHRREMRAMVVVTDAGTYAR
jgi:plastocyanin